MLTDRKVEHIGPLGSKAMIEQTFNGPTIRLPQKTYIYLKKNTFRPLNRVMAIRMYFSTSITKNNSAENISLFWGSNNLWC